MKKLIILLFISFNCYAVEHKKHLTDRQIYVQTDKSTHKTVWMKNYRFSPSYIVIKVGQKVRFLNIDNLVHNVVESKGLFKSPLLKKNKDFIYVFSKKGKYEFYCEPHRSMGMKGTIRVTK